MQNIKKITDSRLCCGCGACTVACPFECLKMIEIDTNVPSIDNSKCTNCGICLKVCPQYKLDCVSTQIDSFGSILDCQVCYANDLDVRKNSASGGFITALLLYLLDQGEVDAVICLGGGTNPFVNQVLIAKERQTVLTSSGSRYSPASLCTGLKYVLNNEGKYAFVGKPCEINGLRRLELIYPILKERITVTVGLFCHHTPSRNALKEISNDRVVVSERIKDIKYRGNGWPGDFILTLDSGEQIRIPYFEVWNRYFSRVEHMPLSCLLCSDATAENADFSVGDPWGAEYADEKIGQSLVLLRTDKAVKIFTKMKELDYLTSRKIKPEKVSEFQKNLVKKQKASLLWKYALFWNEGKSRVEIVKNIIFSEKFSLRQKMSFIKKVRIVEIKSNRGEC